MVGEKGELINNLILRVKGYYNRRFMENWDHNQS